MSSISAPWTTGQLKRLGKCIRDDQPVPESLPLYDDVMAFYNELAVETQEVIESLDFAGLHGIGSFEVTSRSKTIDTLRQKLQRDPSTPLSSIQDVAGVRLEAEMSLRQQDGVAQAIAARFGHTPDSIRDLRVDPHSGYRAVHIWLRRPARVEVQIRTHLQGGWANLYEVTADIFGRDIRYGEIPEQEGQADFVRSLQALSSSRIRQLEESRVQIEDLQVRIEKLRAKRVRLASLKVSTKDFPDLADVLEGSMNDIVDIEATIERLSNEAQRIEAYVSKGMAGLADTLMSQGGVEGFSWPDL